MRRLNVRRAQIDECVEKSLFALSAKPQPQLQKGELLLLQLVKQEARKLGKLHTRIDFALVFDHLGPDPYGTFSRTHWPDEGRVWPWITYCTATIPTIPFSLEDLQLSQTYDGQDNARFIEPEDEKLIRPFVQWSLAQSPQPELQIVPAQRMAEAFGDDRTLSGIYNHDRIAILNPTPTKSIQVLEFERNQWLADSLKSYYKHRCQICEHDFEPIYSVAMADSHHIQYLRNEGPDISGNIVVLCPNHHRVIHATDAEFDRSMYTYTYPNGLREPLAVPGHLVKAPLVRSDLITL